jgi:hypothetical protein
MINRFLARVGTFGAILILALAVLVVGFGGGIVEHFRLTSSNAQQGDQNGSQDGQGGTQGQSQDGQTGTQGEQGNSGSQQAGQSGTQGESQEGDNAPGAGQKSSTSPTK